MTISDIEPSNLGQKGRTSKQLRDNGMGSAWRCLVLRGGAGRQV